jgi:hypothetical protein
VLSDAPAIVRTLVPELEPGDVVAILSNGGFGDIYRLLPAALTEVLRNRCEPGASQREAETAKRLAIV